MTRKFHTSFILATAAFAALASIACDVAPTGNDEAPQRELTDAIAVATTDDGSEFRFYEPVAGEIVVTARAKAGGDLSAMEMLDADEPSALALYRRLTRTEAPATLVAAHARATAAMHQAVADADAGRIRIEDAPVADTTLASSALTSAEFRDRYCKSPSDWDYVACLTNYDAAFSVGRLGVSLGCRVQGQRGQTLMVHQTWYPFSWSGVSFVVDPQEIFYTRTYGFFTDRKCAAIPLPSPSEPRPRYDVSAWGDNI